MSEHGRQGGTMRRWWSSSRVERAAVRSLAAGALFLGLTVGAPQGAHGQIVSPEGEVTVATGNSAVVGHDGTLERVSIGNPEVADAVVISAQEVVVNGRRPGSTTLLLWDRSGARTLYTVRVTADVASLQREFDRLFPGQGIHASAMGATVILTGQVEDPQAARKALVLAQALGGEEATVLDHMSVPERGQILLRVRFAEVSRSALQQLGSHFMRVDPFNPRGDDEGAFGAGGGSPFSGGFLDGSGPDQTFSDAVNFFLFHRASNVAALIQALRARGLFKSLAEPNLLAMPAESASFLAGGEFPFPVLQGGAGSNAATIQFKEFGIRLSFVPDITNSGAIRIKVAPEVSSLDFANGLEVSGFRIPALTSRRAETVIELEDGQTFAIAGLMDHTLTESVNKVPILGDIPILGSLFTSKEMRQNQTELLVLVTPHIVGPLDEAPPVPTGEPETWRWNKSMQKLADDGGDDGS